MSELNVVPAKKELNADQIAERQVGKMSNRQMSARLKRITRTSEHNMDAVWAIVLSQVFDNTKPYGRMEPYLR